MDTSSVEGIAPFTSNLAIPTAVRDTRQPGEKQLAVYFIFGSLLLQFTTAYSIQYNAIDALKLNKALNWTPDHSINIVQIFYAINFVAMFISAVLSDAKLDRVKTILFGSVFPLCLIGFVLFTLTSTGRFLCVDDVPTYRNDISFIHEKCAPAILGSFILIAIGDGVVRANLIAFGADQIQESHATSRFCDKVLAIMSVAAIVEISLKLLVLQYQDYVIFYVITSSATFLAAVLLLIGWRYYIRVKPYDSALLNCIPVYQNAFQVWRHYVQNQRSIKRKHTDILATNSLNPFNSISNQDEQESIRIDERPARILDFAKTVNHGKFQDRIVDDVKSLQSAFIISIIVLPCWVILAQLLTIFPVQAASMTAASAHELSNAINVMLIIEQVVTIIGIIILNVFVDQYLHPRNRSLSIANKFVTAMVLGCITMLIAGGAEILRQYDCHENQTVSNINIYAQVPQHVSAGLVQTFGMLASFEFAYFIAPRSARSLFISLSIIGRGVGGAIAFVYLSHLANPATGIDFSCQSNALWRAYAYFYVLAGVQIVFIIVFIICKKYYRIINYNYNG